MAEQLGAESLLLGARADKLNNAVLVAILETPYVRCLMDSTLINMARDPRIGEVQQLFQHFDQLGLLDKACACTVLVPSTSTLPVEEAIETIARDGKPKPLELQSYLNLLAQRWEVQDTRPYRRDR